VSANLGTTTKSSRTTKSALAIRGQDFTLVLEAPEHHADCCERLLIFVHIVTKPAEFVENVWGGQHLTSSRLKNSSDVVHQTTVRNAPWKRPSARFSAPATDNCMPQANNYLPQFEDTVIDLLPLVNPLIQLCSSSCKSGPPFYIWHHFCIIHIV
jgi:hypothetical protein